VRSSDGLEEIVVNVVFGIEKQLSADEFIDLLRRSTLAERRPVDQPGRIQGMIDHADLIITARLDEKLVGVSRAITDFNFCTYLSDLAVDEAFQKHGIGRELIQRTHRAAGLHTSLILVAAPKARTYYPHIGMAAHDSCWIIPPVE
jgi:GNAT superfamily N-acetyltransferase